MAERSSLALIRATGRSWGFRVSKIVRWFRACWGRPFDQWVSAGLRAGMVGDVGSQIAWMKFVGLGIVGAGAGAGDKGVLEDRVGELLGGDSEGSAGVGLAGGMRSRSLFWASVQRWLSWMFSEMSSWTAEWAYARSVRSASRS